MELMASQGFLHEQDIQVSRGLIRGATVRNIFGYNTAITTAFIPAWEFVSAYTYPVSAITMTVTSASASDDGKTLLIQGLDANYAEISDTVTINGGGDINTNKPFFRINDVILTSGTTNVGLITIQNTGKTVKYAGIRAGDGRNQASIYTVPADKEFYLYRIDAFSNDGVSAQPGLFRNFSQSSTGQQYTVARTTFYSNMNVQRRIPFKYSEKTDIQFQLRTNSGTHEMNVFGEGILVDVPRTMYTGS
jgi:hypothetical protein